jgi:hypothetical protein
VDAEKQPLMSRWKITKTEGFKNIKYEGELPPLTEGSFGSIADSNDLLYFHFEGIWKLTINDL